MLTFITVTSVTLVLAQVNTFLFHSFLITNIMDTIPLLFTAFLTSVGIIHLHTAFKRIEIVQLINSYNQHLKHMGSKRATNTYWPIIWNVDSLVVCDLHVFNLL
jgi:hypothetical protein